jgi:eukaryotic-like serine/threonine-protein kinase
MTAQQLATHTDLTGRVLLGRYRIVRELAKGGMGVVYLARVEGAVGFVKPVVVKLLLPEHTEDDRIVSMFVREARILAQLRHPSLVDVLEFGEQDGGYVLVLEYVRGYHLGLWLRYLAAKSRTAAADLLLQIVIDVLEALHHAHTQLHPDGSPMQIVHRDVSPSNILLDETGRGRLLDFGVARMRGGGHEYKTQVQGGFMGKLPYTAPEIFSGGEASPRSDLYACAVVLHEAIIGRNVFRGETQAGTLQRVLNHLPEALETGERDVPRGLDQVLARALAKNPAERHEDAHQLALDLRKLLHPSESEVRARLAELLKDDFGLEMSKLFNLESLADRDVAWRRLSFSEPAPSPVTPANDQAATAPGLAKQAPAPVGATQVSRNRRGNTQGDPPQPAAATATAPVAPANDVLAPEPARVRPLYIVAGLGALAAVACAVVWLMTMRSQPPPPPHGAAGMPTVFHPVNPIRATPEPTVPPVVEPTSQPVAATPGPDPTQADKGKKPKPSAPSASMLTRAIRKQHTKLETCFVNHSVKLEGHATTQLLFDLPENSEQARVELSPKLLAQTELGQCLLTVARSTRFPPQPKAVSFAIPLTASRE